MEKMKKIASLLLAMVMAMGLAVPTFAATETSESADYTYETISIAELNEYPEVETFIENSDASIITYDEALAQAEEDYLDEVNSYLIAGDQEPITTEDLQHIYEKYNLEEEADEYLRAQVDQNYEMVVEYDTDTQAVTDVWQFQFIRSSSGFSMKVASTEKDPIDSITGTVQLYELNGKTWTTSAQKKATINRTNVKDGETFFSWTTPVHYVSDKFIYNFTVKNNKKVVSYNNQNLENTVRYNFTAGPFKSISANGGHRHHFVSKSALGAYGYNTDQAYAIRMIAADHEKTGSYGSTKFITDEKQYLAQKDYDGLLDFEVLHMQTTWDEKNKKTLYSKYKPQVDACIVGYERMFGIA